MMNNLDPVDFFPGYDPYTCLGRHTSSRSPAQPHSCLWTNVIAILMSIALCAAGLYYYQIIGKDLLETLKNPTDTPKERNCIEAGHLRDLKKELKALKNKVDKTDIWRKQLDSLFSKMHLQPELTVEKKVMEALDIYDSDKIGLFDFAAMYASGCVISTPDTVPYPVNKTINIFNMLKINVLSNPENMLQPSNIPGNCFAFYGDEGKIRIKLGKKIAIKAVTIDHIKLHEDISSAPRDFAVYGLLRADAPQPDILLGKFTYKIKGRPYQTFQIVKNESSLFEYVELQILNNYGRKDFTCLYRFRVHDRFVERN